MPEHWRNAKALECYKKCFLLLDQYRAESGFSSNLHKRKLLIKSALLNNHDAFLFGTDQDLYYAQYERCESASIVFSDLFNEVVRLCRQVEQIQGRKCTCPYKHRSEHQR